ncbi:MAG: bifunctional methylenetetrahydrofolate dehydrogenase/methenyltetrahydrofolate cyclohydrolase FolD [Christensenellales bacterium]|jgi:methylenetetrahydrofolate dehydrogenase (NADP+)/methenyltetrahydrofolate cyclohydrolase
MNAQIIDGKKIAAETREAIKTRVHGLKKRGKTPGLAVVLVGEDPASQVYVRNKEKGCEEVGIYSRVYRLQESTSQQALLCLIEELNANEAIHGILVQLPLPNHIDELSVLRAIDPKKDVDGFHVQSAGALMVGEKGFVACTPKGIIKLIQSTGVPIMGKRAVVVGRSNIVGKPVSLLLLQEHATVTICHSRTADLKEETLRADILVAAIGVPEFIKGDMIKPGAIVIDVGTSRVDGKLKGDVAFDEAAAVASYITPVPGGVGPMTITMLLENTLEACEANA